MENADATPRLSWRFATEAEAAIEHAFEALAAREIFALTVDDYRTGHPAVR